MLAGWVSSSTSSGLREPMRQQGGCARGHCLDRREAEEFVARGRNEDVGRRQRAAVLAGVLEVAPVPDAVAQALVRALEDLG